MSKTLIRLVFLWLFSVVVKNENPCNDYKILTLSGDRDPQCPYDANDDKCDLFIKENWFRPEDGQGNFPKMSTQCVPTSSCGSLFPLWLNGSHPSQDEGTVNITVCTSTLDGCCQFNHTIQVTNCSNFYVYYLVPSMTCPSRYCFESGLPCPTTTTLTPSTSVAPSNTTEIDNSATTQQSLKFMVSVMALSTIISVHVMQTP